MPQSVHSGMCPHTSGRARSLRYLPMALGPGAQRASSTNRCVTLPSLPVAAVTSHPARLTVPVAVCVPSVVLRACERGKSRNTHPTRACECARLERASGRLSLVSSRMTVGLGGCAAQNPTVAIPNKIIWMPSTVPPCVLIAPRSARGKWQVKRTRARRPRREICMPK